MGAKAKSKNFAKEVCKAPSDLPCTRLLRRFLVSFPTYSRRTVSERQSSEIPSRGQGPEGRAEPRQKRGWVWRTWLSRPPSARAPHVPQAACQPGCQNPSSRLYLLSQAWHVFTPLAGRDDSPEQMLQLRYFLNENLCFMLIQIYKGRGETSKSPYSAWLSNGCGIKTVTTFPLTSHRSRAQQKHTMFPEMPEGTSPSSHPRGIQHFYMALPAISCSPDALAALPVVLQPPPRFPG